MQDIISNTSVTEIYIGPILYIDEFVWKYVTKMFDPITYFRIIQYNSFAIYIRYIVCLYLYVSSYDP